MQKALRNEIEHATLRTKPLRRFRFYHRDPHARGPVKYKVDKESVTIFVDRLMITAMHYPCNYGYVPHTIFDVFDSVEVLVTTPVPLNTGMVVRCHTL